MHQARVWTPLTPTCSSPTSLNKSFLEVGSPVKRKKNGALRERKMVRPLIKENMEALEALVEHGQQLKKKRATKTYSKQIIGDGQMA